MTSFDDCSYQLHICVTQPIRVLVGAWGEREFPPGHYIYTGSARRNLSARIARHLRSHKRLRWHIDYLLNDPHVHITTVTTSKQAECRWHQATAGRVLHPGFGASDCRADCGGHLLYVSSAESISPTS